MPLLDHFHAPLTNRRTWEGVHGLWAAALVEELNGEILAAEYFADFQVHVGSVVEVDVATLEEPTPEGSAPTEGGTATKVKKKYAPPATDLILPTVFPDEIEVQVYATTAGAELVGAIEMVSPRNKDRPEARLAFTAKCVGYLMRGIGLIVVDIVTNRLSNLHNEIVELLGHGGRFLLPPEACLYAVAYRPTRQQAGDQIELWPVPLTLGQPLPTLPLKLRNADTIPIDLETTYTTACVRARL